MGLDMYAWTVDPADLDDQDVTRQVDVYDVLQEAVIHSVVLDWQAIAINPDIDVSLLVNLAQGGDQVFHLHVLLRCLND